MAIVDAPADPARITQLRQALHEQVRRRSIGARASFDALAEALRMSPAMMGDHPMRAALPRLPSWTRQYRNRLDRAGG